MRPERFLFRLLLGSRLPTTEGALRVPGLHRPVVIRRDRWGIPHIEAQSEPDVWFGLGFCHGQDRTFQLEGLLRTVRGTLAELIGREGLAVDRLSRRIGFRRAADDQLETIAPDLRETLSSYTRGIAAGQRLGLRRRPHEFVLLRASPTAWTPADVLGLLKLQSFLVPSNWDMELTRIRILVEDGPQALAALDPTAPVWLSHTVLPPAEQVGPAVRRLVGEIAQFLEAVGGGGASNGWALTAERTATGRPMLANDPHLAPTLPPYWYLAHLVTPEWAAAGASFVGGPGIVSGHNGVAAWGLAAGLFDNTDLYFEEIGADGRSVREGDQMAPCVLRRERIAVRRGRAVTEDVLLTPRGPIIAPPPKGSSHAVSLRATWLDPLAADGLLRAHRARSFAEFRDIWARWPAVPFQFVYADTSGAVGALAAGRTPRRRGGYGAIPSPGWDPGYRWEAGPVAAADMPSRLDPAGGLVIAANGPPDPEGSGPFLGLDWIDGYRESRIREALESRTDWTIDRMAALQIDLRSLPWQELRDTVLATPVRDPAVRRALDLLGGWDGRVTAASPAATVFELFLAEMATRVAAAKAPHSSGATRLPGPGYFTPQGAFLVRWLHHLIRLMRERPAGWFDRPWEEETAAALAITIRRIEAHYGGRPPAWAWGRVRPLTVPHALGRRRPLGRVFNLGPFPWGGDANTVGQAAVSVTNPGANPLCTASLRTVVDVGAWGNSRFVLPGGQSGNPASPHYDDQLPLWRRGEGVPIAWSAAEVRQATRHTLRLEPALGRAPPI